MRRTEEKVQEANKPAPHIQPPTTRLFLATSFSPPTPPSVLHQDDPGRLDGGKKRPGGAGGSDAK